MRADTQPLAVDLAGIPLRNPVMLASGTAGVLDEMWAEGGPLDLSRVGAVTTKSITPMARAGNQTWRIVEARAGMLNAIGLANPGINAFEEHALPRAASVPTNVFVSIAGFAVEDYVRLAARIDEWAGDAEGGGGGGVRAIELNISCPNVRTGTEFGSSAALARELIGAVRPVVRRARLFAKLSPGACESPAVAAALVEGGADALTVCNTMPAMAIDVHTRRPRLANVTGGVSGAALHPIAVRLVHQLHRGVGGVPIIGCGGVMSWEDAAEFILAGASAVEIGTGLFVDPRLPIKVARGLARWVRRQGCANIAELVGAVRAGE